VLPKERAVVSLVTHQRQTTKGYWFVPQIYLTGEYELEQWLSHVRWKSLNGYGVECKAWLKEPDAKTVSHISLPYMVSLINNVTED
jgi:hypothetical protein